MKRFYTIRRCGIAATFGLLTTGCLPAIAQQTTTQERFGPDQLQTLGVGSRAVAMGNAFAAIADDASASFWNPGRLGFLANKKQTMLSYRTVGNSFSRSNVAGPSEIGFQPGKPQLGFASFTYPLTKKGGGSLGILAISYTLGGYFSEDRTQISLANDINGNPTSKTYLSSETQTVVRNSFLTLAYGRKINDHLGIGLGVFFVNQDFNKNSNLYTYTFDPANPNAAPLANPNTASERGRGYGGSVGIFYNLPKPGLQQPKTAADAAPKPTTEPNAKTGAEIKLSPPAIPTDLTATSRNTLVKLTWNASPGATSYTLYRRDSKTDQYTKPDTKTHQKTFVRTTQNEKVISDVKGTFYTDTDVKNDTTYFYTVKAVNQYYGEKGTVVTGESGESKEIKATPIDTGIDYGFGLSYRSQTHLSGLGDQGQGFNEELPGRFSIGISRDQYLGSYYTRRYTNEFDAQKTVIEKDHLVTSLEFQVLQAANRSYDVAGNLNLQDTRRAVGNIHFGLEYTPGRLSRTGDKNGYQIPLRIGVHTNSNAAYKYSYYDTVFSFGMAYIEKVGKLEKFSIEPTVEVLTHTGTFNFTLTGQLKF